jgi:hypothetical protein
VPAIASQKPKKQSAPFAIIGGTVFRESGFVFPGVRVILTPAPEDSGRQVPRTQNAVTDARGEFAFRVPATAMRYRVLASAKGFETQEKQVSVQGEERSEVTLTLVASSNK